MIHNTNDRYETNSSYRHFLCFFPRPDSETVEDFKAICSYGCSTFVAGYLVKLLTYMYM